MHLLPTGFLDRYPDRPAHMTPLGQFTFLRTYARFLPAEGRRETWKETVARAVKYNVGLDPRHRAKIGLPIPRDWLEKEAEALFDAVFNLRQFPSGRTLWVGGTRVAEAYPMANYNCSFTNIEKWADLGELFYLLMLGSGVGFKCTPDMAAHLAPIRTNTRLILSEYNPVPADYRLERTDLRQLENGFAKIYVGDSKEGWRDALTEYLSLLTERRYEHVHTIKVSFNSVRPKGERLKTFGGSASGPEPLREMFAGIDAVLKNRIDPSLAPIEADVKGYGRVRPIHILDIGNLIGNNVVSGGVRRTAEIFLFDPRDFECLFAKYGINGFRSEAHFRQHGLVREQLQKMGIRPPAWFDGLSQKSHDAAAGGGAPFCPGRPLIGHRRLSNNSAAFLEKPADDLLRLIFLMIQLDGEPGFVNLEAARMRRENVEGVNPCGEILLDSKEQCNLTTVNLCAFRGPDGFDLKAAERAQALSARAGLRMTLIDLELPEWNEKHKRDRLTGCSLTGVQDAFAGLGEAEEDRALEALSRAARDAAAQYAHRLRIPAPLLATTIKPEGTLSLVAGGVSAGLHYAHAPYFIRRIRISSDDALARAALALGWNVQPEIGTPDGDIAKARTLVIDFPVASGSRVTKGDVPALRQLENYIRFQKRYTQHNSSNTITVRPEEWADVERAISEVWDDFVGVSFLAHDGGTYHLAPYEAITKERYEALRPVNRPFDPAFLIQFENVWETPDTQDDDCAGGACPVR